LDFEFLRKVRSSPLSQRIPGSLPHQIVPLAETTIYELERRGAFPRRFNLTARCVVWELEEIEAWIDTRKQASRSGQDGKTFGQDVPQRKHRPVRGSTRSR
jgi:prophage regulatory protein